MRPFQIIILSLFGALAVGGLLMFATFRGFSQKDDVLRAGVTVWGTLDQRAVEQTLGDIATNDQRWSAVHYIQKDERTFADAFVNSVAEGQGPDLILIPNDMLAKHMSKVIVLPYTNLSVRDFKTTFAEGAEIFLFPEGFYAFPLAIDPLVMYWNRTMISSARLTNPPRSWEELVRDTVPAVTKREDNNDIAKATLAFGEYANVYNAKSVLLMLMMQAGSQLVEMVNNSLAVRLNTGSASGGASNSPADAALRFFTQFANPATVTYTWNRAMRIDRDAFLAEDLALYFGFGSEYLSLKDGNANLNFDVTEVPQGADQSNRKGYGIIYGFTIPKSSKNSAGAYEVAQTLTMGEPADALVRKLSLAPARRDLIAAKNGNPVGDVIYQAALIAHGWLDPNRDVSDGAFKDMVESITAGRSNISEAIQDATYQIQKAF
jgi:ABC-type glycerol-3-phosphate transport system substrate-binding protein